MKLFKGYYVEKNNFYFLRSLINVLDGEVSIPYYYIENYVGI